MHELTTFQVVSGGASILALLITLMGLALRSLRAYRDVRKGAEHRFEKEISVFKAAGGSISGRTDLGFLVLLEIGSLRATTSRIRNDTILFAISSTAFLLLLILVLLLRDTIGAPYLRLWYIGLKLLASVASAMVIVNVVVEFRLWRYTKMFEKRIKDVWVRPVEERADKSGG